MKVVMGRGRGGDGGGVGWWLLVSLNNMAKGKMMERLECTFSSRSTNTNHCIFFKHPEARFSSGRYLLKRYCPFYVTLVPSWESYKSL